MTVLIKDSRLTALVCDHTYRLVLSICPNDDVLEQCVWDKSILVLSRLIKRAILNPHHRYFLRTVLYRIQYVFHTTCVIISDRLLTQLE